MKKHNTTIYFSISLFLNTVDIINKVMTRDFPVSFINETKYIIKF